MKALLKKLKVPSIHDKLAILGDPNDLFNPKKSSLLFTIDSDLKRQDEAYSFILSFVMDLQSLTDILPTLINKIEEKGVLWIAYPKKSSTIKTDINRDRAREVFTSFNYRPVSMVSIDENWSAIRIKPQSQVNVSKKENIPEIDYAARKIYLPKEIELVLKNEHLMDVFDKLSFTHKKEHIEAIVLAKKEETKLRRMNKLIEFLKNKQTKK